VQVFRYSLRVVCVIVCGGVCDLCLVCELDLNLYLIVVGL
jgi:hypothetical protein